MSTGKRKADFEDDKLLSRSSIQFATRSDRGILSVFFDATNGIRWKTKHNWISDTDISHRSGITVNDENSVTAIYLPNNRLSGVYSQS